MVANKPKMTRPTVYQFKLGDFTLTNVLEGYIHREDMHPATGTNATADEVRAVAERIFHNLVFHAVEDDHHLHKTFHTLHWETLLADEKVQGS